MAEGTISMEQTRLDRLIDDLGKIQSTLTIAGRVVEEEMDGSYPLSDLHNVLRGATDDLRKTISTIYTMQEGEEATPE